MAEKDPANLPQKSFIFENNRDARLVCGICDENLALIERELQVEFHMRGNELRLSGSAEKRQEAQKVLARLYDLVKMGGAPNRAETKGALAIIASAFSHPVPRTGRSRRNTGERAIPPARPPEGTAQTAACKNNGAATLSRKNQPQRKQAKGAVMSANMHSAIAGNSTASPAVFTHITTRKKIIYARTPMQNAYMDAMQKAHLVFGIGPAGTGKTYLAVAYSASLLENGLVERIILSRPAVEAGERLGFLPGDMKEKVDPYLRPLYDALYDMMPAEKVERALANGTIEIAPLAFMRGRTLAHAAIILDEAQNTTSMQMKMLLTRLGEGSHMVVNGDPSQIDLPAGQQSGLTEAAELLQNVDNIALIRFSDQDVVRHPLVTAIIRAYAQKAWKKQDNLLEGSG